MVANCATEPVGTSPSSGHTRYVNRLQPASPSTTALLFVRQDCYKGSLLLHVEAVAPAETRFLKGSDAKPSLFHAL